MELKELHKLVSPSINEEVLARMMFKATGKENVVFKHLESRDSSTTKGDSYLSNIVRITVHGAFVNEGSGDSMDVSIPIIIKTLPKHMGRRKTFRSLDFFRNEIAFYEKVLPALLQFQASKKLENPFTNHPLCVGTYSDGNSDYVAMVDLQPEGYGSASRQSGMDYDQTVFLLRILARFHALSFAYRDQRPEDFRRLADSLQETYFGDKFRDWYIDFQKKMSFNVTKDAIEKELGPTYLEKFIERVVNTDFYGEMVQLRNTSSPYDVICQGDSWVPNFLLKYDSNNKPECAKMIDFQLTKASSFSLDLSFFLYCCTDHILREKHWDDLLVVYHEAFVGLLNDLGSTGSSFTMDMLKADLKNCAKFGMGMAMEAIPFSIMDESDIPDLDTIKGDEAVPLTDIWIVPMLKTPEARQRLAFTVKHAIDNQFI